MIRVLVVDDDKLVRKGLISMMPWSRFGMEVVGEASNGEKALRFLEANDVELMLTDLGMPVLSGMELMRVVRGRFPELPVVVLTLHQDFEYIQEALRLGAIDYIAKVELEKEQLEDVLGRIAERIRDKPRGEAAGRSPAGIREPSLQCGYALIGLDGQDEGGRIEQLKQDAQAEAIAVDRNAWLLLAARGSEERLQAAVSRHSGSSRDTAWIQWSDLHGFTLAELQSWVRTFAGTELFYAFDPRSPVLSLCILPGDEGPLQPEGGEQELEPLKELLLSGEWLYDDRLFGRLKGGIKGMRIPRPKLMGLLYAFASERNRIFSSTWDGKLEVDESFSSWHRIEQWLEAVREKLRLLAAKIHYSQDIVNCVMKAEQMMRARLDQPLTSAEIAKEMNMSRSYFSQCFKDIMGRTFKEHVREIRMEQARQYLLHTNRTIQWIAEHTGYMDEKYFSRIFRDQSGMLPSEYRVRKRTPRQL